MLDFDLQNSESLIFIFLKFIRPNTNSFFNCLNPAGVKSIKRLRLGLSYLWDHKFKHVFQDCLNPICICCIEIETTAHYLLHCPYYLPERKNLLDNIKSVFPNILEQSDSFINNVLVFGDTSLDDSSNKSILNVTINYRPSTKNCDDSIFMFQEEQ